MPALYPEITPPCVLLFSKAHHKAWGLGWVQHEDTGLETLHLPSRLPMHQIQLTHWSSPHPFVSLFDMGGNASSSPCFLYLQFSPLSLPFLGHI